MTNKKLGNSFENEFAKVMADAGFWVHLLNQNSAGQPADVIACKGQRPFLIDCKVCSHNKFPLSRIEENQHLAMQRWYDTWNGTGWFALKFDDCVVMVSYLTLKNLMNKGYSALTRADLPSNGFLLKEWVEIYGY